MKRLMEVLFAALGLLVLSPLLLAVMYLVWREDGHSPLYIAPRVGKNKKMFPLVKMRSMVIDADKNGGTSTSTGDRRITPVGKFIRKYKIDELTQLWNVLKGDLSLVGPRPQVPSGVSVYTETENGLLRVKPGITDLASIVFSDEGEILENYQDPDLAYNQLIRPGKGMLSLFNIEHSSIWLDLLLCVLTVVSIVSRRYALQGIQVVLRALGAEDNLLTIASRKNPLVPMPPPGSEQIITCSSGQPS